MKKLSSIQNEKVSNGSFTGSATGWTLGTGWAYSSNTVVKNADGTGTLSQDVSAIAGETYAVVFTISSLTVGSFTPSIGGVSGSSVSSNGRHTQYITTTGTGNLIFTPTNTSRFTIDDISVKKTNFKKIGAVSE